MTPAIRNALVVLPLGLILYGCSDWTESTVKPDSSGSTASLEPEVRNPPSPIRMTMVREDVPPPLPAYPSVDFEELSAHVQNKSAVIIDARSQSSFARGHVRGAINIPAGEKESYTDQHLRHLDRDQLMIIYCGSSTCHASDMLYDYLTTQGFSNMRLYPPGWQRLATATNLQ
jgi:rhodanese-related sulfurtransferase